MKLIIKNALVVTMKDSDEVINNGCVCINDDKIEYVGKKIPEAYSDARVIDGKNRAVMPGLVNAHTHSPMILMRSFADDMALHEWLFNRIFPVEDKLTSEDVYWASKLGIIEMLASGVTCFADMYYFMDRVAEASSEAGIRAHLSRGLINQDADIDIARDERIQENISLFKDWNGACNGRIKVAFAPHACYTCSPEYIWAICEVAEQYKADIHVHVDETAKEHEDCIQKYDKTPVRHLYDLGLFDMPTLAAHCVHITEQDMELLAEKEVSIIHNPGSNLKLGSGIAPIVQAARKGINIALGTDGASSNNNLNMFEEMNLAALITKGVTMNPTAVPAKEALRMATINGARAVGMMNTGCIEAGYKADLVMLNLDKPHLTPNNNVISNVVYSAQASDVETVMVDGRILYNKGQFLTLDYEEIKYNVNKICKRILI